MRVNSVSSAIVLRTRPYGESDKIVSFFTENYGKLTGIAKGAMRSRRRFVNSLEPFALVNLSFQDSAHSNLAFILSADLVCSFRQLATGLDRITFASYLVEITDGLSAEREENSAVFRHLKDGLIYLAENGTSLRFLTAFELKLLSLAGYQPIFDFCKRCRKNRINGGVAQWHFSPRDGGILCELCSPHFAEILPLGRTAVEVLTALQAGGDDLPVGMCLPLSVVKEIRSIVLQFIQFQMDREIKSAPFLEHFCPV
jgi:DNA repair protein RecO (recombination protein O)